MFQKATIDEIVKLAHLLVDTKRQDESPDILKCFRSGRVPEDIPHDGERENWLTLTGEECTQYHRCLNALGQERELESSSKNEIDKSLWHFVCEVFFGSENLKDPRSLKKKLAAFQQHVVKPIEKYEVMISIPNFQVGNYTYEIAGAKFFTLTPEFAESWGLKKDLPWDKDYYEATINHTIAFIHEEGADTWKAASRAKQRLITALNMIRVALLVDHDPRIVGWKIHDEQMLFPYGEGTAVKKSGESEPVLVGWQRGFHPFDLKIDDPIEYQLAKSRVIIESLFSKNEIRGKLRNRIIRSMEWIGNSVTREKPDDKIVDICTALETLLATKQDQRKGEFITLRMVLLYAMLKKPFFNPGYIMNLYLKRSDIIHGSNTDICTDSDYVIGRSIAVEVVINTIEYLKKSGITKHSKFVAQLAADESLVQQAIEICKALPEYYDDLCKAAEIMKMHA
jgi:hypothetical protein